MRPRQGNRHRQMKALGVQYVKKFKMSTIQNLRSVIELEVLRKPDG